MRRVRRSLSGTTPDDLMVRTAAAQALTKGLEAPARPVAAIVGGAKVSGKLELLGNLVGKVNIQICFAGVADAADVRHWPLENWEKFLRFVEAWGVPPRAICNFDDPKRDVSDWKRSGWTCHAAAPFNDHTDGGGAPIRKLLAR